MGLEIRKEFNHYVLRTSHDIIGDKEATELFKGVESFSREGLSFILDFSLVKKVKPKAIEKLQDLAAFCFEHKLAVVMVAEKELYQFFFDHGLTYLIPGHRDLTEAQRALPLNIRPLDRDKVNFHESLIRATQNTFEEMCHIPVKAGQEFTREEGKVIRSDLSSLINIQTGLFKAILILNFPKQTLTGLVKLMLEEENLDFGQEVQSSAVEFLNCLMGQLKQEMKNIELKWGIPSLVLGGSSENNPLEMMKVAKSTLIPFHTSAGDFFVEYMAYVKK